MTESSHATPSFLEKLTRPLPKAEQEKIGLLKLTPQQVKGLAYLANNNELQQLMRLNHLLAFQSESDTPQATSTKATPEMMLSLNIQKSAATLQGFLTMLSKNKEAQADGLSLPTNQLPTNWRTDFTKARRKALNHIKRVAPECYDDAKTTDGLAYLTQHTKDVPHDAIDAVHLLQMLDTVQTALKPYFPTVNQIALSASEPITLTKDEVTLIQGKNMQKFLLTLDRYAPDLAMDEGIAKMEVFFCTLPEKARETMVAKDSVPRPEDIVPFLQKARKRMVHKLLEQAPDLFQPFVHDEHGEQTISPYDIAKIVIAADLQSSSNDALCRQFITNQERPDARHHLKHNLFNIYPKEVRETIEDLCAVDLANGMWSKTLEDIHARMARQQARADSGVAR